MNDLIKRADAIKALTEVLFDEPPYLNSIEKCETFARKTLDSVQSVEPIEVHKYCWVKEFGGDGADCFHDFEPNGICQACGFMKISYAEPKQGEWITDIYKLGKERHRCSECGTGSVEDSNYCPNCGARMK